MDLAGDLPASDSSRRPESRSPIGFHLLPLRTGRALEVWEYGDPGGHPALFFHGLIGSHNQASYIAEDARRQGIRVIAPNRPGVGRSEFARRRSALDAVADVVDVVEALGLGAFSLIGISGGAPYVLAALSRLGPRVRTATLISGMGPPHLPGALRGMRRSDRIGLEVGSRHPALARREFRRWSDRFRADPQRFLDGFIARLIPSDRLLFRDGELAQMFMRDLRQVFVAGNGPDGLAQELVVFRNTRIPLESLPAECRVTLWHGLGDVLVPPAMAWALARRIPNCEAHFVPGGHFVAVEIAGRVVSRLRSLLDGPSAE